VSLEPRKYSERLGVLDAEQLQAACDAFDLGTVTGAEMPPGGLFGQNVILTTTSGRYVFRGNPHGHVQLTKERVVARFIHERSSLPAPWPYEVSDDTETFGWTFAVMPCLPGEPGTSLWEAEDDRVALAVATGEALTKMHEASGDFFGPYDPQLDDFVEMDDFRDWALHRFDHWRNACRAANALGTDAERYIDEMLDECAPALDVPFEPVLVHHDFKFGNLTFEPRGDGFEASGVFDLFEAYLADGEEDIVRMLWLTNRAARTAFADAYVAARPLRDGASERLTIYALSDWMCIWEYGARHGGFEGTTFLDRAVPIVRNARAVAG
jgi:aminoglycoside phosphotransferase (APT) family kinase protein